jgi:hypothetical protein
MSDQLLTVLKFALLAVLYLFFLRVVRAVWAELKEPKRSTAPPVAPPLPPVAPPLPPVAPPMPSAATAAPPTIIQPSPVRAGAPPPGAPSAGAPPAPAPPAALHLVVVDPPEAQGRTFPLGQGGHVELTVGRAPGCGLALTEDSFVSQLHARLFRTDGTWQIEDLGSTNGTFLNRRKVSGPQSVHPGDRIQVGRTVLELVR